MGANDVYGCQYDPEDGWCVTRHHPWRVIPVVSELPDVTTAQRIAEEMNLARDAGATHEHQRVLFLVGEWCGQYIANTPRGAEDLGRGASVYNWRSRVLGDFLAALPKVIAFETEPVRGSAAVHAVKGGGP